MLKFIRSVLDWIGHFETIQTIVHTEFVRTLLLPTVWTVLVAAGGYVQGIPLMWIMMAAALTFMAVTQALLRADELKERKNPEHKLTYAIVFQMDLNEAPMPLVGNRQQRRGQQVRKMPRQMLSPTQLSPQVSRKIKKGQLGIEVTNNANFPISACLLNADTEIEDFSPPRSDFPKNIVLIAAKDKMRFMDDAMELDDIACQKLNGEMDITVRYGLPGKERYDLKVKGPVQINMEHYGFVSSLLLDRSGG